MYHDHYNFIHISDVMQPEQYFYCVHYVYTQYNLLRSLCLVRAVPLSGPKHDEQVSHSQRLCKTMAIQISIIQPV